MFTVEFVCGDSIDTKDYDYPHPLPAVGETFYLDCENPNQGDTYGHWFEVVERRYYYFTSIKPANRRIKVELICKRGLAPGAR